MLKRLEDSKRAKKEFKYFKEQIEKIESLDVKQKGLNLLSNLQAQNHMIYEAHISPVNKSVDPKRIRENIKTLVSIRTQLKKLIKDANA